MLAPNLYWLAEHDFISIRLHVAEERSTDHPLAVVAHALSFVGAFVALSSTGVASNAPLFRFADSKASLAFLKALSASCRLTVVAAIRESLTHRSLV